MKDRANRVLLILLLAYCGASLVHFVHNAEFLRHYPGLPESWSRLGVYLAWAGMTLVGGIGSTLYFRGYRRVGLAILAVYAALGFDSIGHYFVAPLSAHSTGMNSTILLEVGLAMLVLVEVIRRAFGEMRRTKRA